MRIIQEEVTRTMESINSLSAASLDESVKMKVKNILPSVEAASVFAKPVFKWAIAASVTALLFINWYVINHSSVSHTNDFAESYFSYMKSI